MTNHMTKVAEILSVELKEAFRIIGAKNGNYYRLSKENGVEMSYDNINWEKFSGELLRLLMLGEVKIEKLPWKPRDNEYYFIPDITTPEKFSSLKWVNDNVDKYMYKHRLICCTSEEAIRKAKLLMEYFENNCIERNENNG